MTPIEQDDRGGLPSASEMDRDVACQGAWQASQSVPRSPGGKLAQQGTKIHDALHDDDDEGLEVDEATIKANLQKIEAEAVKEWMIDRQINVPASVIREERLYFRAKSLEPLATGRIDVAHIAGQSGLIINYKTGFKKAADARGSWQLRTEMLCLWHDLTKSVKHIRVAFAQSRLGSSFSFCDYDLTDIKHSEAELLHVLWKIKLPGAPRVPGQHCTFCPANTDCIEAAVYASITKEIVDRATGKLDHAAQKAVWLRKRPTEAIFESITESLKALPADQLAALGLQLEPNSPSRFVQNPQALFELLYHAGLLTPPTQADPEAPAREFHSWCKTTLGQMEKVVLPRLAEKNGTPQTKAKEALAVLIGPTLGTKPKAPSLTLLNDV